MILILGGTTEGRIAVQTLEEAGKPFYYSTKGAEQEVPLHNGIRRHGAMDAIELAAFCRKQDIRLLIDAAHPFARELHRTVEQVSTELDIPAIRYERIYPERNDAWVIWCDDYDDAIRRIKKEEIFTLLALTGVQSIGKLKSLWQESVCCYFRILDRDSSRELARREGYPEEHLYYYHEGEDERFLMRQLHPEAILIKESGTSGGFGEKVEAACEIGIRVFAIRRPATPATFLTVNGRHGLRRMVEKLLPGFYPLRSGLTTGTCAAAAAVAATWDLFTAIHNRPRPKEFPVTLPCGETIPVPVEERQRFPRSRYINGEWMIVAEAAVVKDAGDDPDITHGITICANVAIPFRVDGFSPREGEHDRDYNIIVRGGEGVGIVTLPGLGIEVGTSAINATPRRMIEDNVKACLERLRIPKTENPFVVTISVPGGEELARRTFNPRLGVEGGISIIGTSGIVRPFSTDAFVDSIRKSMEVARATGSARCVLSSGAKSERFVKACYPELPPQAFVHYGNFIGEALKMAAEQEWQHVTLGVMIGKAVKLAEGNLDTHSKKVTMNKGFIGETARRAGCGEETAAAIDRMILARELWEIIPADRIERFSSLLIEKCHAYCDPLLPGSKLTILLITENGKIYT